MMKLTGLCCQQWHTRHTSLALILTCILLKIRDCATATSAGSLLTRPSSISSEVTNLTANLPPQDFTIKFVPSSGTQRVHHVFIFDLIFSALSDLALQDFDATYPRPEKRYYATYNHNKYATLIIHGAIFGEAWHIKHAVWGLTLAIQLMAKHQVYCNWQIELLSRGEREGVLIFMLDRPLTDSLPGVATSSSQNATQTSLSSDGFLDGTNPIPANRFQCTSFGKSVPFTDAMMAFVGGFTIVAPMDKSNPVSLADFAGTFPGFPNAEFDLVMSPVPVSVKLACDMLYQLSHFNLYQAPASLTESTIVFTNDRTKDVIGIGELRFVGGSTHGAGDVGAGRNSSTF